MKLIYRGINYQDRLQIQLEDSSNNQISFDYHLNRNTNNDRVIQVKPIYYYTYRGISYTKNLIVDPYAKLLLNIGRQSA